MGRFPGDLPQLLQTPQLPDIFLDGMKAFSWISHISLFYIPSLGQWHSLPILDSACDKAKISSTLIIKPSFIFHTSPCQLLGRLLTSLLLLEPLLSDSALCLLLLTVELAIVIGIFRLHGREVIRSSHMMGHECKAVWGNKEIGSCQQSHSQATWHWNIIYYCSEFNINYRRPMAVLCFSFRAPQETWSCQLIFIQFGIPLLAFLFESSNGWQSLLCPWWMCLLLLGVQSDGARKAWSSYITRGKLWSRSHFICGCVFIRGCGNGKT